MTYVMRSCSISDTLCVCLCVYRMFRLLLSFCLSVCVVCRFFSFCLIKLKLSARAVAVRCVIFFGFICVVSKKTI